MDVVYRVLIYYFKCGLCHWLNDSNKQRYYKKDDHLRLRVLLIIWFNSYKHLYRHSSTCFSISLVSISKFKLFSNSYSFFCTSFCFSSSLLAILTHSMQSCSSKISYSPPFLYLLALRLSRQKRGFFSFDTFSLTLSFNFYFCLKVGTWQTCIQLLTYCCALVGLLYSAESIGILLVIWCTF